MNHKIKNTILILIVLISTAMHFNYFNRDLISMHVWRQTQTQSTIINFYEEDMNILNPRKNDRGDTDGIFRMEFPIMQWLVAMLFKIFGNHLIISRLFMFLIGLLSVLGIYKLLDALFHNTTLSIIGAWAFNFSPSFYYYTINPLPDNFAMCFSVWGLAMFFKWQGNKKNRDLFLSGLFLSVGALSKLPFIIYYIVPIVYFVRLAIMHGIKREYFTQAFLAFGFSVFPVGWYLTVIPQWHGNMIVKGMLENNASPEKLMNYYLFNLFSTVPELLVGYGSLIFFLAGFYYLFRNKAFKNPKFLPLLALSLLALVFYFFEANAIANVHDYYLFPFYPLLFILVAYGAINFFNTGKPIRRYLTYILIIFAPFACYIRMHDRWNPDSPGFNKDLLLYKTELQNAVPKQSLVVAGNDESHFIFFYYIDKKGWAFNDDDLKPEYLRQMIDKGAEFLYTDSKAVMNNSDLANYLDGLVLEKGSIKIYKLKK